MNDFTIISDLHLGSHVCRSDLVLNFLDTLNTRTLILNGDVFDNLDFRRLQSDHWKILKKLRSIAKYTVTYWVRGNHDKDAEIISHLIGATFVDDLLIKSGEVERIYVVHGDVFDEFIQGRPITSKIADYIYRMIQRFDQYFNKNHYYSNLVKKKSKSIIRCGKVVENAIKFCKKNGFRIIICGHTHMPVQLHTKEDGIQYHNSGCWTDKVCNYIEINNGKIELKEYYETNSEGN